MVEIASLRNIPMSEDACYRMHRSHLQPSSVLSCAFCNYDNRMVSCLEYDVKQPENILLQINGTSRNKEQVDI